MKIKAFIKYLTTNLKYIFYRIKKHGKGSYIGKNCKIIGGPNLEIGNNVSIRPYSSLACMVSAKISIANGCDIGERFRINAAHSIIIDENVLFGPNVYISDDDHKYSIINVPIMYQGIKNENNRIIIDEGSWIGINCVIVGNVHIGKHVVIGANSVVTKDIPNYAVATGAPAKVIKIYDNILKRYVGYRGI